MSALFTRRLSLLSVVLAALIVSGCASKFTADVTRFNDLPPPAGETVQIVGKDPLLERGLEFASFANLVGAALERQGYRPPVAGEQADIVAAIAYGVGPGRQPLRGEGGGTSVGVGVGGGSGGGLGVGLGAAFDLSGGGKDPVHVRSLTLELTRVADDRRLFEGRAISEGRNNDLGSVMPYLVEALFKDFPGQNGETIEVRLDVTEGK